MRTITLMAILAAFSGAACAELSFFCGFKQGDTARVTFLEHGIIALDKGKCQLGYAGQSGTTGDVPVYATKETLMKIKSGEERNAVVKMNNEIDAMIASLDSDNCDELTDGLTFMSIPMSYPNKIVVNAHYTTQGGLFNLTTHNDTSTIECTKAN